MSHIVKGPVLKFHGRYQAAVGSPDKYIALHEVGGTVVGRPWLTIPTGAALTDGGQQKWKTARSAPDTFFLRSKAGKLWIAQRKPKGIELLYLLVHQVNMRPRGIFAAVAKEMDGWMSKEGRQVMSQVVRQANG